MGASNHRLCDTSSTAKALGSAVVAIATLIPATAGAQSTTPLPIGAELSAPAVAAASVPVLDGNIVDDPAWRTAPVDQRVLADDAKGGSGGVRAHRSARGLRPRHAVTSASSPSIASPIEIIVADSRRDSSLSDTDSFMIILDTYRDRQNGFVFGTNPAGIQYDGQVTNEGQGSGGGGGTWRSAGRLGRRASTSTGTATGRCARRSRHRLERRVRHPLPDAALPGAGSADLGHQLPAEHPPPQRDRVLGAADAAVQPLPPVAGRQPDRPRDSPAAQPADHAVRARRERGRRLTARGTEHIGDVGVDLKYGVTPSLTLDGTYNTDFAQVEVDEQQINLDRFSLFFPEKRPFFLENAGLFAVGTAREAEIFFSRRIGIGPDGEEIPIIGGGAPDRPRRTRPTSGCSTSRPSASATTPSNNFSVARVNHELPNRSALGGDRRQPPGHRRSWRARRLQPQLCGRWPAGASAPTA